MRLSEYEKNWSKTDVKEMIFLTNKLRIEGRMHKTDKVRVSDTLNHATNFVIMTNVKAYSLTNGELLVETEFMALNKTTVVMAMEKDITRLHIKALEQ